MVGWVVKASLKPYQQHQDQLTREDYLLWKIRVEIPGSRTTHGDHPVASRMKRSMARSMWWPGRDKDIEHIANACA